jgi:hypothetical protein
MNNPQPMKAEGKDPWRMAEGKDPWRMAERMAECIAERTARKHIDHMLLYLKN